MSVVQALLLGIIQGLTEFIPVSSTAHLLIGQRLLGLGAGEAVFAFLVLVQMGTLLALVVYFWKDLWALVRAFPARPFSTPLNRQAWFILIATLPALLAGLLLRPLVQALFRAPLIEAAIRGVLTTQQGLVVASSAPRELRCPAPRSRAADRSPDRHRLNLPHRRIDAGPGRLPRRLPIGVDHQRRPSAGIRSSRCGPVRLPDFHTGHAGRRRL